MASEERVPEIEQPAAVRGRNSTRPLRVLMAAGGTGGHIFPALAVAHALQARFKATLGQDANEVRPEIAFLGTDRGLEARVIPREGFRLHTVAAAGLKNMGFVKRLRNFLVLPKSAMQSASLLRSFRPQVVVGMGGYLAGPVMLEAAVAGIPTLLIEPNAVPGFTNRRLRPFISIAALGFEASSAYFGRKSRWTGHPVRSSISQVVPKAHVPPLTVLIVGGSQGSMAINSGVIAALPLLAKRTEPFKIIHQSGASDYERVRDAYLQAGMDAEVYAFVDDMAGVLSRADLVVSRAGATTVAELAAAGKASVLIPLPSAADQHQRANAQILAELRGTTILEQHDLNAANLCRAIEYLLDNPARLTEMENNARKIFVPDAADRIANLVWELAAKN